MQSSRSSLCLILRCVSSLLQGIQFFELLKGRELGGSVNLSMGPKSRTGHWEGEMDPKTKMEKGQQNKGS